jgi:hypothetical protein
MRPPQRPPRERGIRGTAAQDKLFIGVLPGLAGTYAWHMRETRRGCNIHRKPLAWSLSWARAQTARPQALVLSVKMATLHRWLSHNIHRTAQESTKECW